MPGYANAFFIKGKQHRENFRKDLKTRRLAFSRLVLQPCADGQIVYKINKAGPCRDDEKQLIMKQTLLCSSGSLVFKAVLGLWG